MRQRRGINVVLKTWRLTLLVSACAIQKPFTPRELTRKLREVLDRPLAEVAV